MLPGLNTVQLYAVRHYLTEDAADVSICALCHTAWKMCDLDHYNLMSCKLFGNRPSREDIVNVWERSVWWLSAVADTT